MLLYPRALIRVPFLILVGISAPKPPRMPKAFGILHSSVIRCAAVAKVRPGDDRALTGMMTRERIGAPVLNRSPAQVARAEFSGVMGMPPDVCDVLDVVCVVAQNVDGTTASAEVLNVSRQAIARIA